jgi:hypothetical protein
VSVAGSADLSPGLLRRGDGRPHALCGAGRTLVLCTPLYTIEMLLKMWGLGLWRNDRSYLVDNWCRFDLLVVIASWVDVTLMLMSNGLFAP